MNGYSSALMPQHAELLAASAIAPEVARARAYRSVDTQSALASIGIAKKRRMVPGLLIPIWGVDGEIRLHQYRPDKPYVDAKGESRKYETPFRARMALDVPPAARDRIADPKVPLWITEGARKADAAVSAGLCCVALLGVWNWRGTNELGGKTYLTCWDSVALNNRQVFVCFDSDVMTKDSVAQAMNGMARFLGSRGATVKLVYLPHSDGGKVGLDDYLAAGHTVDDLLGLARDPADHSDATPPPRPPPQFIGTLGHLLNDVHAFLKRYVVFANDHQAIACTLWVAHTWVHLVFDVTARLHISSPEAESGKSTLLEVMDRLVCEPLRASSASPSALFRGIEELHPTVLLDEVDNFLKGVDKGDKGDVIGIINDGYRADGAVLRVVGEGKGMRVQKFSVFAPLVLTGLSKLRLPTTTASRTIPIGMRPRTDNEHVERWRLRDGRKAAAPIRERLEAWSGTDAAKAFGDARPDLPGELSNRQQDIWEPLLAIADAAGDTWPRAARDAAVYLHTKSLSASRGARHSLGVALLNDIRRVWNAKWPKQDKVATEDLLDALCALDEAPWRTLGKDHTPLNARRLATMLGDYGVRPGPKSIPGYADGKRGYDRADFKDAWSRYPADSPSSTPSQVQGPQESHGQGVSDDSGPASTSDDLHDEKPPKPRGQGNLADLAGQNGHQADGGACIADGCDSPSRLGCWTCWPHARLERERRAT